jgi:hypothetical protein
LPFEEKLNKLLESAKYKPYIRQGNLASGRIPDIKKAVAAV